MAHAANETVHVDNHRYRIADHIQDGKVHRTTTKKTSDATGPTYVRIARREDEGTWSTVYDNRP